MKRKYEMLMQSFLPEAALVYQIKQCVTSPWFSRNPLLVDKVVTEGLHLTFLASFGEHFEHLIREKNSSVFSDKENTWNVTLFVYICKCMDTNFWSWVIVQSYILVEVYLGLFFKLVN